MAIAPFCASRGRLPFLWRFELMGSGFAGSDYLDAIVRRGHELEAVRALADYVKQKDAALHLVRLPPSSSLSRLAAPLAESGWSVRAAADGFCPFIRLAGHSWDSFLATIGPAHRATTRRRLRSLERDFTMRFEQITDDAMRQHALASSSISIARASGAAERHFTRRPCASSISTSPIVCTGPACCASSCFI